MRGDNESSNVERRKGQGRTKITEIVLEINLD